MRAHTHTCNEKQIASRHRFLCLGRVVFLSTGHALKATAVY